jgi:integral membrane sensor domain MASE1
MDPASESNDVDRYLSRRPVRIGLVILSVVAAASVGGGFVAGVLLVPLLLATVRHVSVGGAVGLVLLATILVVEMAWGATYLLAGEQRPLIWVVPLLASIAAVAIGARSVIAAARRSSLADDAST